MMNSTLPIIDYDNFGNILTDTTVEQTKRSFQNRLILNEWVNFCFDYYCVSGLGFESFGKSMDYQMTLDNKYWKYYWGEHSFKKANEDLVFGTCPFVYNTNKYLKGKYEKKYQVFFLPKSDDPRKTILRTRKKFYRKLIDEIDSLNLENPIFISFCLDTKFYSTVLPERILKRTYCFGHTGFEQNWMDKVTKTLLYAKEIYVDMFSSTPVYAGFLGVKCNFYKSQLRFASPNFKNTYDSEYTVDLGKRDSQFRETLEYLEDIFSKDCDDKKYFINKFLSLERFKEPEQLFYDLKRLHEIGIQDKIDCKYNPYNFDCKELQEKCKDFGASPTETAMNYYDLL